MTNMFKVGLGIVGGLATGFFVGYKIAMSKAQKIADEQVEDTKRALKKYYESKIEKCKAEKELISDMGVDPGINDENKVVNKDAREEFQEDSETVSTPVVKPKKPQKPKEVEPEEKIISDGYPDPEDKKAPPYPIREEDYGALDDWDTCDLILWRCGTVTTDDSMCEMVSPTLLMRLLPENWPNMFGNASVICFRNNQERRDVQIQKDNRTYRQWLEEVYPGRVDELDEE